MNIKSQSDFLKNLEKWGFKVNHLNKKIVGINNLIENYNSIEKKRYNTLLSDTCFHRT